MILGWDIWRTEDFEGGLKKNPGLDIENSMYTRFFCKEEI